MSWNLFKDLIHLGCGEGPHGLRPYVSECAHARGEGHDSIIVLGLRGKDRVKSAHGPVDVFDFDAEIRPGINQGLGSFRGLANLTDTLISKIYQRDVGRHNVLFAPQNKKASAPCVQKQERLACGVWYPLADNTVGFTSKPQTTMPSLRSRVSLSAACDEATNV
jgi:hypothetical protein